MTAPLPHGFRISLDPGTRELAPGLLFGGSPARVLRLTATGQAAWRALAGGPVGSAATGTLARRLTDAGLAHPVPPAATAPDVTVVIPVHGRAGLLARCLAAVGGNHPVLVVDDASPTPSPSPRSPPRTARNCSAGTPTAAPRRPGTLP